MWSINIVEQSFEILGVPDDLMCATMGNDCKTDTIHFQDGQIAKGEVCCCNHAELLVFIISLVIL